MTAKLPTGFGEGEPRLDLFCIMAAGLVAVGVVVLAVAVNLLQSVHKVEEGYVGVSTFGGAVSETLLQPGYHVHVPFLQSVLPLPITMQTVLVQNVPCGTSSGIVIEYERVEVVYQLRRQLAVETVKNYSNGYEQLWIHDTVRHAINEICSVNSLQEIYIEKFASLDELLVGMLQQIHAVWAPGIHVISSRTTKPVIPTAIQKNYEQIEDQRTQLMIKEQEEKRILKREETDGRKLVITAQKEFEIMKMTTQQRLQERISEAEISKIDVEMSRDRAIAFADAKFDRDMQRADGFARKLTPQFLKMRRMLAELQGTRMYLGEHVPSKIVEAPASTLTASCSACQAPQIEEDLLDILN